MKSRIVVPLFFAGMLILTLSCGKKTSESKSMEQLHAENGVPVRVQEVTAGNFTSELSYYAVLTGIKESTASAALGDKVEKIHYKVGAEVKKDEVIISFPTDNPAAHYNQAKVAFEFAEASYARMESLYESGGISLQELENVRTQYEVARANWEAVKQSVEVKAPISGVLTQLNVSESDNVTPGDILFTVSQTHRMKAKLWVPEGEIEFISTGARATAFWSGKIIEGSVVQVDISLNTNMQAFGVMVEFDNTQAQLKSGVNANITIHRDIGANIILIHRKNIVVEENRSYVYIADGSIARKREIIPGDTYNLDVAVLEGLAVGDLLIFEGQMLLEDGVKINIITEY